MEAKRDGQKGENIKDSFQMLDFYLKGSFSLDENNQMKLTDPSSKILFYFFVVKKELITWVDIYFKWTTNFINFLL